MHEILTILTDVSGICLSVCLSRVLCAWGHSVQPLPNAFVLLLTTFTDVKICL